MSKKQVANVIIIDENDRFLIIKRTKTAPSHPLHWDLPGGHVEEGESLEEAVKREALEETNLEISDLKAAKVQDSFRNFFIAKKYSGNIEFKQNPESGFVEHSEYKWVTLEIYKKMEDLSIKPEDIEKAMENLSKKSLYEQKYQERLEILLIEGRKEDVFKKYAALGEDILNDLASIDQEHNYKHLNWMAKQLIKIPDWDVYSTYGKEQEASKAIEALDKFLEYKPRLKKKDINQYRNIPEIYADIDEYVIKPQIAKSVKKRKEDPRAQEFLDADDGTIVYEDERYFVVRPDTMESSCYFGQKTKWCIAQTGNSYFNQYVGEDKSFYFIKDEGMRDDDVFRKMAVQIGHDRGVPIFEMFWDRYDDSHSQGSTDDWEEAAEQLSSESGIPLQIAEKIMQAIFDHAENYSPRKSALIKLAEKVETGEFNTKYVKFTPGYGWADYEEQSYMTPTGYVSIKIPIKNKTLLDMLSQGDQYTDWEGDRYDIIDALEERFTDAFEGRISDFVDLSTGEEVDIDVKKIGPSDESYFLQNIFNSYSSYGDVEVKVYWSPVNTFVRLNFVVWESGSEPSFTSDADEAESFFTDTSNEFNEEYVDEQLPKLESLIYSLIPEIVTATSDLDKIDSEFRDINSEAKNITVEDIEVNEYYRNIKLKTVFSNISVPNYAPVRNPLIKLITQDSLLVIWNASKKAAKNQMQLKFNKKYNAKNVDYPMPEFDIDIHASRRQEGTLDTKVKVAISTLIKFLDTSEEMLIVYNFFKFIDKNYSKLLKILEKNIYNYVSYSKDKDETSEGTPQLEESKKCWPGYEKKGTKKMFGKTVNNCVKKEEVEIVDEAEGKKDACYHKVKSRYKVWPSAYASGALVKCRKVGAKNWGNSKKESLRIIIEDEISQVLLENQDDDSLEKAIMKALKDEGGAAGLDALEKHTDATEEEIKSIIKKSEKIQTHRDDDIIDMSGLEEGYIKDYAKHSALNLGQVLRHLKYLTDLPGTNNKLEATKKRLRYIINDLYYTVTPGQWHHSQEELDELSKYKYKDLLKMGFDPDFADKMLSVSPEIEMQEAIIEEIIKQETERYLTEKKKKKAGTESSKESSLKDWFGRKGAKGSKKGWVDCNSPDGKGGYKACGRSSGEKRKKYPACRPTPGACKEKGKGKSWGKKAKKSKKGK